MSVAHVCPVSGSLKQVAVFLASAVGESYGFTGHVIQPGCSSVSAIS